MESNYIYPHPGKIETVCKSNARKPERPRVRLTAALCYILAAACFFSTAAKAHESIGSVSNSILIVEGRTANYYLSAPPSLISLLNRLYGGDESLISEYFMESLKLSSQGGACDPENFYGPDPQPSGNRIVRIVYECPDNIKTLSFKSSLFFDLDEKHIQFIRLSNPENPREFLREATLTLRNPDFIIDDVHVGGGIGSRIHSFFILGIEHILTGYDHILFLLSAILVTSSIWGTAKVITSFSVAHSITLALAFLGVVSIRSDIVEPLIAFSIVYVAAENIWKKECGRRWVATFIFGLVHGLGFVGALNKITVSKKELLTSLVSFNVGIEIGQLIVAAVIIPALYFARKRFGNRLFLRWSSAAILCAGLFLFIERVWFYYLP